MMSASLIGRFGSSAFRLSTTAVSISLTGSRFSSLLARVMGVGIETADMLVHEVLSRNMRDRRAVARYAGLTGSPDESGRKRREKGLARSGNARVRRGMIQLAWRFLLHQKNSALTKWFRSRTENARGTRKPMIVALARKLLIALWRLVREGIVPDGVVFRAAQ
jgi:transposase